MGLMGGPSMEEAGPKEGEDPSQRCHGASMLPAHPPPAPGPSGCPSALLLGSG